MFMAQPRVWGAAVALSAVVMLGTSPSRADDLKKMQGTWKVVLAHVAGEELTKAQVEKLEIIIADDKLTLVEPDRKEVVHFVLDSDAKPPHIDFYKGAGKKDKVYHGIYDFDGKSLKLCWALLEDGRPTRFGSKEKNQKRYFVLEKK